MFDVRKRERTYISVLVRLRDEGTLTCDKLDALRGSGDFQFIIGNSECKNSFRFCPSRTGKIDIFSFIYFINIVRVLDSMFNHGGKMQILSTVSQRDSRDALISFLILKTSTRNI